MLVLMFAQLDSRQMTELLDSEQRRGLMIEQHVEAELANDRQRPDVVASLFRAIGEIVGAARAAVITGDL